MILEFGGAMELEYKKTKLRFKSMEELKEFITLAELKCEVDNEKLIISCEISDADLELAKRGFHAEIV